ncbi:hypothetical protein HN51_043616 [Arachis hypogaea]
MSASHRKSKGKATGKRKRGDSSQSIISLMHDTSWQEKNFTPQEKANQLLPANDPIKFANRYCELKYSAFANSRNLYLERTLKVPEALQQYTTEQIKQRGCEPKGKANSGHRGSHRDHSPAPNQVRSARWFCTG